MRPSLLGEIAGNRGFSGQTSCERTPVEKRIRSSHIVILTAVSSLLLACVITSPVLFTGAESRNGSPAAEASILAERHLDRAMEEMEKTGNCSAEGRILSCDDGCGAVYRLDMKVVREPSGAASRVSVRVRWKGPLGGGAVVATGLCGETTDYGQTALSEGSVDNGLANTGRADAVTVD